MGGTPTRAGQPAGNRGAGLEVRDRRATKAEARAAHPLHPPVSHIIRMAESEVQTSALR